MFEEVGKKFLENKLLIHDNTEESTLEIKSKTDENKKSVQQNNTIDLTLNFEGKEEIKREGINIYFYDFDYFLKFLQECFGFYH